MNKRMISYHGYVLIAAILLIFENLISWTSFEYMLTNQLSSYEFICQYTSLTFSFDAISQTFFPAVSFVSQIYLGSISVS